MRRLLVCALVLVCGCGDAGLATVGTLTIDPPALVVPAGGDARLTAHLADEGTPLALPAAVGWTVRDPLIATVSADGDGGAVLHGLAPGSTVITATLGGTTARAALTVADPELIGIDVLPPTQTVVSGECATFTATGRYSDGSTRPLDSGEVGWGINGQQFQQDGRGSFCPFGLDGQFTVWVGFRELLGSAVLVVTPAAVVDLQLFIEPVLPIGTASFANAFASFSDGTVLKVGAMGAWSSSDAAVLTVDAAGQVHAVGLGQATVGVTFAGFTRTAAVEVRPTVLTFLDIEPASLTVAVGGQLQLTARGFYDNGQTVDVTAMTTWSTLDPTVVTVDSGGVMSGVAPGSAFVRAQVDAFIDTRAVQVTP